MEGYKFPPFHSFPPSFTRQPVETTRAKQTELWCDLIREYCRVQRIFWLDVSKAHESNLFSNPAIDRRLSDEDIRYFLGQLVARGDGEWDPDRKRCLVFWRRPSDWGELIYQWIDSTARNGELLTIHEIRKGRATVGQGKYYHQMFHELKKLADSKAYKGISLICQSFTIWKLIR